MLKILFIIRINKTYSYVLWNVTTLNIFFKEFFQEKNYGVKFFVIEISYSYVFFKGNNLLRRSFMLWYDVE